MNVAVVRDPFDRFLSAHTDHGSLSETCPDRYCTVDSGKLLAQYERRARRLAALAAGGRPGKRPVNVNLVPPLAFIHQLTQSYFLSATDARGAPLEWHALVRLEAIEDELAPVLEASTRASCRGERCEGAWRGRRPLFPRRNKKINPLNQYRELRAALLNRTEAMCDVCQYFVQDYFCLGFAFPDACLRPACVNAPGRPSLLRRALRLDCERRGWPAPCTRRAFSSRGSP
eukprot:7099771-Prymnesium_polylepis.1